MAGIPARTNRPRAARRGRPGAGPPVWRELLHPAHLAAIAVIFWMSGPVAPFIPNLDRNVTALYASQGAGMSDQVDLNEGLLRMSWLPVYAIALVLVQRHWRPIAAAATRNWVLVLLIGWTLLSTLWSVSPADTLRRSVALTLSTAFGIYLATRYNVLGVVRLLAAALAIDVAASVVCAVALPAIGVEGSGDYAGAWRGVFMSKNQLGAMMLITCLAFYVLYLADRRRVYLAVIGAALGLLMLSISRTPLVILISLVPALALFRRFLRDPQGFGLILALALSVSGLLAVAFVVMIQPLLALFGRDLTFTGRTDIWDLSWAAIQQSYWVGYGYGAFWSNPLGPANSIWDTLNWRVPSSHSGLLELWLALGLIGVTIFAVLLLRTFSAIAAYGAQAAREECMWLMGYYLIFIVHAVTEPTSMDQTSLSWVMFVAAASSARAWAPQRSARVGRQALPWSPQRLPGIAPPELGRRPAAGWRGGAVAALRPSLRDADPGAMDGA